MSHTARMEKLSDELLLLIWGYVSNVDTLLCSVPRVCKRWRDLSRDREAWASAVLSMNECENYDWDKPSAGESSWKRTCTRRNFDLELHLLMQRSAGVLLHAPALRTLDFGSDDNPLVCFYDKRVVLSALRRTRATVTNLILPASDGTYDEDDPSGYYDMLDQLDDAGRGVLLDFMTRSRRTLRSLELGSALRLPEVEAAVSQLSALRSLSLELVHTAFQPTGALRGALPNLERLEVKTHGEHPIDLRYGDLLADLVGGAAGTLRTLRLGEGGYRLPEHALAEVRRCARLRELAVSVWDVAVLDSLPSLRSLKLGPGLDGYPGGEDVNDEYIDALTFAALTVRQLGPRESLRTLVVAHCDSDCVDGIDPDLKAATQELVDALVSVVPRLRTLDIRTDLCVVPPTLGIESTPRLRTLSSVLCRPEALPALAALPKLRKLTAAVNCEDPPKHHWSNRCAHCKTAVADFELERPEVVADLDVYSFGGAPIFYD